MLQIIPFTKYSGKNVLEIGCGAGIDTAEFARNGAMVSSIDFTQNSVEITKKTLAEAGAEAEVFLMDARKLNFKESSFDLVYSFGVLHHVEDVGAVLSEIIRVLKPAGEGIFMVYNKDSLLNAYSIIFLHRGERLSEEQLASKYSERNPGNPYTKLYSADEARELFQRHFQMTDLTTHFPVIDLPHKRKVKIQAPNELGWHHILHCTTPKKNSH
jgi:ubiquinone/menaquinone biosynthesis C-methylase UbiE